MPQSQGLPKGSSSRVRVLAAMLFAAICVSAVATAQDNPYTRKTLSDPAYMDATPVSVQVADVRFRIPRHYLYAQVQAKQPQTSMLLLALGPKLEPRTSETQSITWLTHEQIVMRFGYDPVITILVQDARRFFTFDKIAESRTSEEGVLFIGRTADGLDRYSRYPPSSVHFTEISIERDNGQASALIQCRPTVIVPACRLIFRQGLLQVEASYSMHRSRFADWRDLRAAIAVKLNSFALQ